VSTVDVSSTDDEVSPADFSWLTTYLTVNIFQTITLFDELFAPLEILRHALRDHVIFTKFWELLIFSLSLFVEAILSILSFLCEF
jgi:hypothetical protein